MADATHPTPRPIDEDMALQRRMWRFERVGWCGLVAVAVAALAGLLGPGPLSRAHAHAPRATVSVEYQRFARSGAPAELRVHVGSAAATTDGVARVAISRAYLEGVDLEEVVPHPASTVAARDALVFAFALAAPGQPTAITFRTMPRSVGFRPARVALVGVHGAEVSFRQVVYP